jgi:hypothetical protein
MKRQYANCKRCFFTCFFLLGIHGSTVCMVDMGYTGYIEYWQILVSPVQSIPAHWSIGPIHVQCKERCASQTPNKLIIWAFWMRSGSSIFRFFNLGMLRPTIKSFIVYWSLIEKVLSKMKTETWECADCFIWYKKLGLVIDDSSLWYCFIRVISSIFLISNETY